MTVPQDARARLVARFGPYAEEWCDTLPERLALLAGRWSLVLGEQSGGGTSRVVRCRLADGADAYLKLTPDPDVARQEAEALRLWDGEGRTPRLLDAAPAEGALLIAAVDGADGRAARTLAESLREGTDGEFGPGGRAGERLGEVAVLLASLRGRVPGPGTALPSLAERIDFLFELTRRRIDAATAVTVSAREPAAAVTATEAAAVTVPTAVEKEAPTEADREPGPGDLAVTPELVEGCRRAALALARSGPAFLVHGDLHPGNVLDPGGGAGLVAIDPRPCVGDPDFDAVDWVLTGVRSEAAVHGRIRWLAELVPGLDEARVRGWCRATAVIIAGPRAARGARDPHTRLLLGLTALADASE
ncbi:aminoglycoside phosphotransferase family protein [Streptomyces sp. PTM05]|uniref:Aminoglycoside phosphotransferase family protein n=1 Tax=Streptantibioticus parmotrematis TaxID=2873249 RepID=A0ABS7QLK4_9ACTN|nr:aminoglycoside phosphotransferase family protein [Streptantibioticus parmotrematis]MBY8883260.1 aminoglycoside phosphotransferase family protein [Streptantibioticus parmotrematis]